MQALYAVSFDVRPTQESAGAYDRLRRDLADWLGAGGHAQAPTSRDLERDGEVVLGESTPGYGARTVGWALAGGSRTRALRAAIQQPLPDGEAQFVTRVTVSEAEDGDCGLRVVMGREIPNGWIAPVQDPPIRRPNLLRSVLTDAELDVRVLGQRATGRYERIRDGEHAAILTESLAIRTRLPILLVHPRDDAGWTTAFHAAGQLVGLAQVVTLNYATARAVQRRHAHVAVPDGGARLVWPNLSFEHLSFTREEVSEDSFVWRRLMPSLAQLSVIARGGDTAWEAARQASHRSAARKAAEQLAAAQARGDRTAERAAFKARVKQLEEAAEFWEAAAEEATKERDKAKADAADSKNLRIERNEWKKLYLELAKSGRPQAACETWTDVPVLAADASSTFEVLTRVSEGRIVFTPNAARAWKISRYPHQQEMTDQLITLAQAAVDLYSGKAAKMPRMDKWFRDRHSLKFANSDDKLSKNKTLRYFEFEGRRDRLAHIKVRDAVSPDEVGRIYFDFDHAGKRLIVDHVGLHL
ncbi:hypothetical protein [Streptomyces peucetius]|uniref:Restriction endonuclease n=1 Tax=Streptomyces peucetius TaxID=1950 RepID=A0ABY6IDD6_STRPE|nr:hypothetical protein [Streptomyces peucetius]UYQ65024.1 hypothetical protein OGH68_28575 [Streptomyces peucetius]